MVPVSTTTPFVVVTPMLASLLLLSAAISDFTAVVIWMSEVAVSVVEATGAELDAAGSGRIGTSGALAGIPLGGGGGPTASSAHRRSSQRPCRQRQSRLRVSCLRRRQNPYACRCGWKYQPWCAR